MKELIITTFTDPMMGLSYECEPMYRKLETHFPQVRFKYIMSVLVRDVSHFMMPGETLPQYNKRLAKIYEAEERIGGMPIHMPELHLFDAQHRSSEPLNLAYKAAQITDRQRADRFLYNLRYATIVETRPTTPFDEIMRVVSKTGIDEEKFKAHPLISPIELREAFDLSSTDEVMEYISKIDNITVEEVPRGCFIRLEEEK